MNTDDPGTDVLAVLLLDAEQEREAERANAKAMREALEAKVADLATLIRTLTSKMDELNAAANAVIISAAKDKGVKGGKKISITVTGRDDNDLIEDATIRIG